MNDRIVAAPRRSKQVHDRIVAALSSAHLGISLTREADAERLVVALREQGLMIVYACDGGCDIAGNGHDADCPLSLGASQ